MAFRIDRGELAKPTKLENGWLRLDGRLTRTGVFSYRLPDGKVRRELRLPEEVFRADAMQSFALVPVTDEHPPAFLDAKNTREYSRGSVGASLRKDGSFVAAEMLITDAELIEKLEKGQAREVSCGYTCDLEDAPGEYQGERYDAVQRNIRGNHVAIVEKGRAGPEARVRMDAGEQQEGPDRPERILTLQSWDFSQGGRVVCDLRSRGDGDDDQPRDESGRWSSGGGGGGSAGGSGRSPEHLKKIADKKLKIAREKEARATEIRKRVSAAEERMSRMGGDVTGEDRVMLPDAEGNEREVSIPEALEEVFSLEALAGEYRTSAMKAQEELRNRPEEFEKRQAAFRAAKSEEDRKFNERLKALRQEPTAPPPGTTNAYEAQARSLEAQGKAPGRTLSGLAGRSSSEQAKAAETLRRASLQGRALGPRQTATLRAKAKPLPSTFKR